MRPRRTKYNFWSGKGWNVTTTSTISRKTWCSINKQWGKWTTKAPIWKPSISWSSRPTISRRNWNNTTNNTNLSMPCFWWKSRCGSKISGFTVKESLNLRTRWSISGNICMTRRILSVRLWQGWRSIRIWQRIQWTINLATSKNR